MEEDLPAAGQPSRWLLIFSRQAAGWWQNFVPLGRFKHVRAIGYVPLFRIWLFYDVSFRGTDLFVVRDRTPEFRALFDNWAYDAEIMWIDAPTVSRSRLPSALLCTTAIKHLIGLRGALLRPDALFKACLANGGKLVDGRTEETRTGADEPVVRPTAAAVGEG